jgi:hypothetical protein
MANVDIMKINTYGNYIIKAQIAGVRGEKNVLVPTVFTLHE